jgi:hypothetical protein
MKKKILTFLSLSLLVSGIGATDSYAASEWTMKTPGAYQMLDGSTLSGVYARGVDTSHWQGDINWKAAAADDVKFLMHGTRYKGKQDPKFVYNMNAAYKEGIALGVYIYSYAMTPAEAEAEADFVLDMIKDYPISYPVAFDVEDMNTQGKLKKEELTAIIRAFTNKIEAAGYHPILYANDYWIANKLDMKALKDLDIWVARYNVKHVYPDPVIWQATETGKVAGFKGNVDIDFQYKDLSSKTKKDTFRTIAGKTYYYKNYIMQKNAWVNDNDKWYFMDGDGLIAKSWKVEGDSKYYLDDTTGAMQVGWKQLDNKWYFFNSNGKMATAWASDGSNRYYMNKDGVMQTGWLNDNGKKYYLKSSGAAATGFNDIDGKKYYMDSEGALGKSWVKDSDKWYFLNNEGIVQKSWIKDADNWFYLNNDGVMQTGWLKEGNNWFYLNGSGIMKTGWFKDGNNWFYLNGSGVMKTGWFKEGNNWFYLDGSGVMKTGLLELDGKKYMLAEDGHLFVSITVNHQGKTYNIDASGVMTEEKATNTSDTYGSAAGPDGNISKEAPSTDTSHSQEAPRS